MRNYRELLEDIIDNGVKSDDRTGVGTLKVFGRQLRFDMSKGFPMLTLREISFRLVVGELLWMLSGSTSAKELDKKYGVKFWNPWALEDGSLGPIYGRQLRNYNGSGLDQVAKLLDKIKKNPSDRRLLITTFNPLEVEEGVLWPCHGLIIHFNVIGDKLNLQVYQRSADVPIGVPFNIAFYSLLTHIFAHLTGYKPGEFILTLGDAHIYLNQVDTVKEMLKRWEIKLPELHMKDFKSLDDLTPDLFELRNYKAHPKMKIEVAV